MNIQSNVLEVVLKNFGTLDDELSKANQLVPEKDFNRILFDLKLTDWNARDLLYWEIQTEIEKQIYLTYDSTRVAENVTEEWNQKKEIEVNVPLIQEFIHLSNIKFPNSRKAFSAICDGDLLSYKAFNSKPDLFVDLLLRYLASICKNSMNISLLAQEILPKIFEDSSRKDVQNSLRRLGFSLKTGTLIFKRVKNYKRVIGEKNLVFSTGMKSILLENLENSEMSDYLRNLYKILIALPHEENEEYEVEAPVSQGSQPLKQENPSNVTNNEGNTQIATTLGNEDSNDPINSTPQEKSEESSVSEQKLPVSIETTLASMHQTLLEVNNLFNTQEVESINTLTQLSVAKEEIKGLQIDLQQEKDKVSHAEEKAYKKILQAIGGESGNFLLSDLFEESQGTIPENPKVSTGRLINLFSSLSLAIGLEEHSFGLSLGDTFKLPKDELIKKFQIDGPIESHENEILIKLVKYGWMINGMIIIQPLVTEIKGDK